MELDEGELASLRWMVICNARGIGFLYPTVNKGVAVTACDRLETDGLARRVIGHGDRSGYWILPKGRDVLHAMILEKITPAAEAPGLKGWEQSNVVEVR